MKSSYQEAYDAWAADQTPENMSVVLDSLMPTINSEIMRYEGPKEHLRSKAKAITISAIKSYKPDSGAKLQSWVTTNLQQLSRYGKNLRDVKAPELAIRRAAEIARVSKEMSYDLGRDPTINELADEIGISPKKIQRIQNQVKTSINSGSFEIENVDGGSGNTPGVSSTDRLAFAAEAAYMSLDPRDRMIFDYRTGSHGKRVMSNGEIARRLGISDAAVSNRANYISGLIQYAAQN